MWWNSIQQQFCATMRTIKTKACVHLQGRKGEVGTVDVAQEGEGEEAGEQVATDPSKYVRLRVIDVAVGCVESIKVEQRLLLLRGGCDGLCVANPHASSSLTLLRLTWL